jgi:uncharacterized protein YjbI with pentapeptide repeats
MQDADFQDADLTDGRGLSVTQLAGTNLCGAKLPETIGAFEGLHHVESTGDIARPVFVLLLLASIYSVATITSTTDAGLLTNSPSELLPEVSTPIPTAAFYIWAPIVLASLHIYLHRYLEILWQDLSALPCVFPDGVELYRKVHPWLVIRLVSHFASGQGRVWWGGVSIPRNVLNFALVLLVWWQVPIIIFFFWIRYLPTHDWGGSCLHIALVILTMTSGGFGIHSYRVKEPVRGFQKELSVFSKVLHVRVFWLSITVGVGILFFIFSYGSISGIRANSYTFSEVRIWVPRVLETVGYGAFPNFRDADVSIKPPRWRDTREDLDFVDGADFKERDLRYTDAVRAFLAKADLSGADLFGANLTEANLEQADLRDANFTNVAGRSARLAGAKLAGANIQDSDFSDADFQDADLRGASLVNVLLIRANFERANVASADLHGANLSGANLQGTNLNNADLEFAILVGADLQGADFRAVNLRGATIFQANARGSNFNYAELNGATGIATDFQKASLNHALLDNAKLSDAKFTEADLRAAKLRGADLRNANLRMANVRFAELQNADLRGANLQQALLALADLTETKFGSTAEGLTKRKTDLRGADLRGSFGLTQEQLDNACGDEETTLTRGLTVSPCT